MLLQYHKHLGEINLSLLYLNFQSLLLLPHLTIYEKKNPKQQNNEIPRWNILM